MLLELRDVEVAYGAVTALRGMNLHVAGGRDRHACSAPTARARPRRCAPSRACCGRVPARSSFDGEPLGSMPAHALVARGMAHVPEGRRVFGRMSVHENLLMGAYRDRRHVRADLDRVFALFPRLAERAAQIGGTLSGGEQQMLAIGRAMMAGLGWCCSTNRRWAGPMIVQTIFEIDRDRQRRRRGGAARRTERRPGTEHRQSRLRARERAAGRSTTPPPTSLADDRVRHAYLGR